MFQSDVARALARFLDIFAARHTGSRRLVLAGECATGAWCGHPAWLESPVINICKWVGVSIKLVYIIYAPI